MIIDHINMHMPGFRDLIVDKVIFSADHFATMEGASNDWTRHGLLHPDQMVGDRCLIEGTGHTTPISNLPMWFIVSSRTWRHFFCPAITVPLRCWQAGRIGATMLNRLIKISDQNNKGIHYGR